MLLAVLLVLALLVLIYMGWSAGCEKNNKQRDIKTLARQTARWSMAAVQDRQPLIALLHANYGNGYLMALNDIARPTEVERVLRASYPGFRYDEFDRAVHRIQDVAAGRALKACPDLYTPEKGVSETLMRLAGHAA